MQASIWYYMVMNMPMPTTLKTTATSAGTASIEKAKFGEAPTYVIGGSVYNYVYIKKIDNRDTSWNDYFYDLRINKTGTKGGAIYSPGVYSKVDVSSNAITYKAYYKAKVLRILSVSS